MIRQHRLSWNLEVFWKERGETPVKAKERTINKLINSNHLWCRGQDSNQSTLAGGECCYHCNTLASISPPVIAFTKQSHKQFDTTMTLSHVQPLN